jgi:hypothetical protein
VLSGVEQGHGHIACCQLGSVYERENHNWLALVAWTPPPRFHSTVHVSFLTRLPGVEQGPRPCCVRPDNQVLSKDHVHIDMLSTGQASHLQVVTLSVGCNKCPTRISSPGCLCSALSQHVVDMDMPGGTLR